MVIPEGGVILSDVLAAQGSHLEYIYDYGDYWQHAIVLEEANLAAAGVPYPGVLGGGRSCPPEDCRGTSGYADFLEILVDPKHRECEQRRAWAGDLSLIHI